MVIWLAVDTMVMVAATLGEADRLWDRWQTFDSTEPPTRFIPRAAHDEFSALVEGIGSARPGIHEEIISDASIAIIRAAPDEPNEADLSAMGLDGTRLERIRRLLPILAQTIDGGWDSIGALDALRKYESDFARRKRDFLARHFVFTPVDEARWTRLSNDILALIPAGGASWRNDCRILAQAAMHIVESDRATSFITEDRRHMARSHCRRILGMTGLTEIRDLIGDPLCQAP